MGAAYPTFLYTPLEMEENIPGNMEPGQILTSRKSSTVSFWDSVLDRGQPEQDESESLQRDPSSMGLTRIGSNNQHALQVSFNPTSCSCVLSSFLRMYLKPSLETN